MMTATYSPEDNKLRLYPAGRLDAETLARVKAAGFKWAPKQELFVAPSWTPGRADLLVDLCGEIGDEDTSLVDRAEDRATRFEGYQERRADDAERAREAVASIADGIPFGQPILVGHHSERRARKDAERIESGMRRAVKMWETSKYWESRAAGALRHAKYKERPDVRARRIKGLEADQRKQQRSRADSERARKMWAAVFDDAKWKAGPDGVVPTPIERARHTANHNHLTVCRPEGAPYGWTAWDVLRPDGERYEACPSWTVEQVQVAAIAAYERAIAYSDRWLSHIGNRLTYERAMLAEDGGTAADRTKPEVGGGVKCWASPRGGWSFVQKVNKVSVSVLDNWGNGGANFARTIPLDKLAGVMSAADVSTARQTGRLVETADGLGFFLVEPKPPASSPAAPVVMRGDLFDGLREHLKAGVKAVAVPQLFETPPPLAARMADLAQIPAGARVLEPSAGSGNLLKAVPGLSPFPGSRRQTWANVVAVEINAMLAESLRALGLADEVRCADFLSCDGDLGTFDRILMNPPFANASDIAHIQYAAGFLNPGGRLVAICANGPRQQSKLKPMVAFWEDLPPGTFTGTDVNAALLLIQS